MKSVIFGFIGLFLLAGCSNISLHVSPQALHSGKCDINIQLDEVARQTHGGPLDLTRQVFKDKDGNYLVYERGQLDDSLIFIVTLPDIMKAGFEMDSYQSFSLDRHHDLITGLGRDGTPLYILAQSLNEGFSILYSQNYQSLQALVECLGEAPAPKLPVISTPQTAQEAIKSDWRNSTFARHRIAVSKYYEEF
jgi:hypothetical protein